MNSNFKEFVVLAAFLIISTGYSGTTWANEDTNRAVELLSSNEIQQESNRKFKLPIFKFGADSNEVAHPEYELYTNNNNNKNLFYKKWNPEKQEMTKERHQQQQQKAVEKLQLQQQQKFLNNFISFNNNNNFLTKTTTATTAKTTTTRSPMPQPGSSKPTKIVNIKLRRNDKYNNIYNNNNNNNNNTKNNSNNNNTKNTIVPSKFRLTFQNPFGQVVGFFGADQSTFFQGYNIFFNAERHTIFHLHTVLAANAHNDSHARGVFDVVSGTLGAAFGVGVHATRSDFGGIAARTEEVKLYDAASLRQSHFNPFNPTRILIHGWMGGSRSAIYTTIVPAYLRRNTTEGRSYNIFTVDWGRGAIADYITASYRVKPVGKVLAKFVDFLHREAGARFEDLHLIGFSMGAHVAGIAGKAVQTGRISIIYALDPALQLFRFDRAAERIDASDADYVEVVHSNAGAYGYDRPLGHADFYVNFGNNQPGCFFNECHHVRAFQAFAESLQAGEPLYGEGCDEQLWQDLIRNRRCLRGTSRNLTLGGDPVQSGRELQHRRGVYNVMATNTKMWSGR